LDVQLVLNLLRTLSPVKFISLKDQTLKLTMLLALTNATRIQSVHLICLNNVHKFKSEFVFKIDDLVKQSRPRYKEPVISCKAYPPDRRLCICIVLKEYALEVEADLTLCEPNILVFIPERFKITFIYLEIVSLVTFL
jgi:hypothetical protein